MELLIVIVVIAILAGITIVAYSGIQARARNTDRLADIDAIHKAVELYYAEYGDYPKQGPLGTGMDTEFPVTSLKLPRSAIVNPQAVAGTTNSITENSTTFSANPTMYYHYHAFDSGGANCWQTTNTCIGYRLRYRVEGDPTTRIIESGIVP